MLRQTPTNRSECTASLPLRSVVGAGHNGLMNADNPSPDGA